MWKISDKWTILSATFIILIIGSSAGTAAELCVCSEDSIQAAVNSASSEEALCSIDFVLPGKLVVNSDTLAGDEKGGVVTGSSGDIPLLADSYGGELQEPDLQENWLENPFEKEDDSGLKSGECLELEDGYILMVSDFSTGGDKAVVKLLKDGEVLEEYILEAGETYYVTSDISGTNPGEKYTLRTGDTWTLNEGYVLTLVGVDVYANKALVSLSKNGVPLDEKIVEVGEHYYYNRSASGEDQIIIDLLLSQVFQGAVDSIAQFIFVAQYSDAGTVDTDPVKIMEVGEEWTLENKYTLLLEDVGVKSESCIITLKKNNIPVDRRVAVEDENYIYQREEESSGIIKTVLEMPVSASFYSDSIRCVEFDSDYSIYPDENTVDIDPVVIVNSGSAWGLDDEYELEINEISGNVKALASILKNDEVLDLDVFGNNYTYQYFRKTSEDGSLQKILEIKVNRIFKGTVNTCVEFSSDYTQNPDLNTVALDDKIILDKLERLELDEGYVLTPEAIDYNENKALFLLTKGELYIDEQILPVNSDYYYNRSIDGEDQVIFTFTFEKTFLGDLNKLVIIQNLVQNPEGSSVGEAPARAISRESAEIRSPVYSAPDLQAILNANGGTLRIDGRNFADFYYDVENGLVGEELSILHASSARTIDSEGLVYRTTVRKADYEYGGAGWADAQYDALGFLGEMFVPLAGSPDKLAMLLLDDDDKYTLRTGELLDLGNGYEVEVKAIDTESKLVWIEFTKDGEFVDDEILDTTDPEDSSWEVDLDGIEGEDDVIVFRVHVNNVLKDEELGEGFAQIQGLWLIDYANAFTLGLGNPIDNLEVDVIGYNYLQLTNPLPITLYMDWEEEIAGDLKSKVADAQELRFYLCREYTAPGTYEVAGEIAEGALPHQWTGLNFAALHYAPDAGIASETLSISSINSRQVQEGDMQYSTAPMESEFEYRDWGSYQAIWFLADEYLAGYTAMNTGFAGEELSLISEGKLCKVLMDSDDEKLLYEGSPLPLSENYSLNVLEVDMNGGTVWVQLEKNGTVVDDAFISLNEDYVYEKSIGTIEDLPLIAVHLGNISYDGEFAGVFVGGIFQVSDSCIEVNAGDSFGKMEITSVSSSRISMENEDTFYLVMDSNIPITDKIWFRVADTETLRYYPFVNVEVLPSLETYLVVDDDQPADYSSIQDAVDNAAPGATILVKPGTYVENVHVDKSLTISSIPGSEDGTIVHDEARDHVFHITADEVDIRGFTITGQNGNCGIALGGVKNCNIDKNKLSNSYYGIGMGYSSNNTLKDNNVSNNYFGIYLDDSSNNKLKDNEVSNNQLGITLYKSYKNALNDNVASNNDIGINLASSNNTMRNNVMSNNTFNFQANIDTINDIDISNTVDGKPIYYLVDISDTVIDSSSNAGMVYCINCQNISINNLTFKNNTCGIYFYNTSTSNVNNSTALNNSYGIYMIYSSNNTFSDNAVSNNDYGIILGYSSNNKLSDNAASKNYFGIYLIYSSNNTLNSNIASNNDYGIYLEDSSNNTLSDNAASKNYFGIALLSTGNNSIFNNTVDSNDPYGIGMGDAGNNFIYNNYFNNNNNTYFEGINTGNVWSITRTEGKNIIGGPYLGGNLWATPTGTGWSQTHEDSNGDGICDEPYHIDGTNVDYLPLYTSVVDSNLLEKVGVYNNEGTWALWNTDTDSADIVGFGWAGAQPVVGDWDGDGTTEVGIYNTAGNNFFIQTDSGAEVIGLGWDGVTPVVGDWNGDGSEEVGVYNNEGTWALWNTDTNSADIVGFGWAGTQPMVGDWDGDGVTEVGIYNTAGNNFFIRTDTGAEVIGLGWPGVTPVVGDWNEDGSEEVGVYNNEGTWALWNTDTNSADIVGFGWAGTKPVVGDWDADGVTELGIYNTGGNNFFIQTDTGAEVIGLGWSGVTPCVGCWN